MREALKIQRFGRWIGVGLTLLVGIAFAARLVPTSAPTLLAAISIIGSAVFLGFRDDKLIALRVAETGNFFEGFLERWQRFATALVLTPLIFGIVGIPEFEWAPSNASAIASGAIIAVVATTLLAAIASLSITFAFGVSVFAFSRKR